MLCIIHKLQYKSDWENKPWISKNNISILWNSLLLGAIKRSLSGAINKESQINHYQCISWLL